MLAILEILVASLLLLSGAALISSGTPHSYRDIPPPKSCVTDNDPNNETIAICEEGSRFLVLPP